VLVALSIDCSRAPRSHRNPVEEPRYEAQDGDADAQYELGVRIAGSPASAPDYAQAADWFRRAADQGHAGAQAALGVMYHRGQGLARSDVDALKWLTLAAAQPSPERDAYAVWKTYVAREMSAADIAEAERQAHSWSRAPQSDGVVQRQ